MTPFEIEKSMFLRFAETLRKSESPEQLRSLLTADLKAPYHTFDLLGVCNFVENIGSELASLMEVNLDADGCPV